MAPAHRLFDQFLTAHGLSGDAAALALGVSKSTISQLRSGGREPRNLLQGMIARWTGGAVPVEAWLSRKDRKAIEAITPIDVTALPARRRAKPAPAAAEQVAAL